MLTSGAALHLEKYIGSLEVEESGLIIVDTGAPTWCDV